MSGALPFELNLWRTGFCPTSHDVVATRCYKMKFKVTSGHCLSLLIQFIPLECFYRLCPSNTRISCFKICFGVPDWLYIRYIQKLTAPIYYGVRVWVLLVQITCIHSACSDVCCLAVQVPEQTLHHSQLHYPPRAADSSTGISTRPTSLGSHGGWPDPGSAGCC